MKQVLILANGDWGSHESVEQIRRVAESADHVIAADGAWDRACDCGIHVDTVIGDMDSLRDAAKVDALPRSVEVLRFPRDKDWTDLELAVDWALKRSPESITICGATGGRIDHTMANLAVLEKGIGTDTALDLVTGRERVRLTDAPVTLDGVAPGDRVSLLPVTSTVRVATSGLVYPLTDEALHRGAGRGVSNVVECLPVHIHVWGGIVAIVHAPGDEGSLR